ncbi:hypothetical protein [Kineothrix alysoides]
MKSLKHMDELDRPIVPALVERIEIDESANTFFYIATFPF